jgi:hypothetical protein
MAINWWTVSGQASQSVTFVDVNRKMNDEIDHLSLQLASLILEEMADKDNNRIVLSSQVEQSDGSFHSRNGGMCGHL